MNRATKQWIIEGLLILLYFNVLVFFFLPLYLRIYAYMFDSAYRFSVYRYLFSLAIVSVSTFILLDQEEHYDSVYLFGIRLVFLLSFIPMIAFFCCGSRLAISLIVEPLLFECILLACLKHYSITSSKKKRLSIKISTVNNVNLVVLIACGFVSFITWGLAGFPFVLSLKGSFEQRIALRENALPTIISYLYTMSGGALLPYLFAWFLIKKQYVRMFLCFVFGLFLFFVNGMKTWLLLYFLAIVLVLVEKKTKDRFYLFITIEVGMISITILSVLAWRRLGMLDFLNQTGRVIIIPNSIGFKYIDFFRSNELLYLRESILRVLFKSPYPGGSDFYINYGVDRTITSGRANNGLFGDAYRNFGILGVLIYPVFTAKVVNIIERNCIYKGSAIRYYLILILIWGAINNSFFTWLLTGGVIALYILLKVDRGNIECMEPISD